MTEVNSKLNQIAAGSDQKQKSEQYKGLLHQILGSGSVEGCRAFVDHSKREQIPYPGKTFCGTTCHDPFPNLACSAL